MELDFTKRSGIVVAARDLYRTAPARARILQRLRPYICPFEDLIRWIPDSGRLLDVGCGAGLFLGLGGTARANVTGIGFDADADAVAAAQGMMKEHFPDGRIAFRHSAVGDPWPEGPFNLVSMIDVLHHIPPPAQQSAIAEAYAHVAPGGLLLYKDMADRPFFRAWWNRFHDLVVAKQWINYRRVSEVEAWLRAEGAEIVERSGAGALRPRVDRREEADVNAAGAGEGRAAMTPALLGVGGVLVFLAWTSVMLPGFAFPWVNNVYHLQIVLDYAGSAEGPHDAFTQSLDNFVSGFWLVLRPFANEGNAFTVFFVAHLIGRIGFVAGVFAVTRTLGADRLAALALAGLAGKRLRLCRQR